MPHRGREQTTAQWSCSHPTCPKSERRSCGLCRARALAVDSSTCARCGCPQCALSCAVSLHWLPRDCRRRGIASPPGSPHCTSSSLGSLQAFGHVVCSQAGRPRAPSSQSRHIRLHPDRMQLDTPQTPHFGGGAAQWSLARQAYGPPHPQHSPGTSRRCRASWSPADSLWAPIPFPSSCGQCVSRQHDALPTGGDFGLSGTQPQSLSKSMLVRRPT